MMLALPEQLIGLDVVMELLEPDEEQLEVVRGIVKVD